MADDPLPPGALPGNLDNRENVRGRRVAPADTGFGQLWHKELSIGIPGASDAAAVMDFWRSHLVELWPQSGELYARRRWARQGDLLGVDIAVGPATVSTGVLVAEASATTLVLVSPQGHMFAGSNRLSTETADGLVRAVITLDLRANDPLYEVGLMFGGHRIEERFWAECLRNLALHYGVPGPVRLTRRRRDRRRQWRQAANLRHNALLRSWLRRFGRAAGLP